MTDNSEIVDPNAKITVDSSHQPSQEFPIGETLVRIIATDSAGNVGRECIFKVEIRGKEHIPHAPGTLASWLETLCTLMTQIIIKYLLTMAALILVKNNGLENTGYNNQPERNYSFLHQCNSSLNFSS